MSGCNFNGAPGKYQDTVEHPIRGQSSGHMISIDQSEAAAVKYQDSVEHGHVIVLNMTRHCAPYDDIDIDTQYLQLSKPLCTMGNQVAPGGHSI